MKKEDRYFVINNSDGDTYVTELAREELLERLNDDYYGDTAEFINTLEAGDTAQWGENAYLIIKGSIVVPFAKNVVKEFDLPV